MSVLCPTCAHDTGFAYSFDLEGRRGECKQCGRHYRLQVVNTGTDQWLIAVDCNPPVWWLMQKAAAWLVRRVRTKFRAMVERA